MDRDKLIESILGHVPENSRDSARATFSKIDSSVLKEVSDKLGPVATEEPVVPTPAAPSPAKKEFPKNNPMGNNAVGKTADGKTVYQNSKGQFYYFTGRGGAAIIGAKDFTKGNKTPEVPKDNERTPTGPSVEDIRRDMFIDATKGMNVDLGFIGGHKTSLDRIRNTSENIKNNPQPQRGMNQGQIDVLRNAGINVGSFGTTNPVDNLNRSVEQMKKTPPKKKGMSEAQMQILRNAGINIGFPGSNSVDQLNNRLREGF